MTKITLPPMPEPVYKRVKCPQCDRHPKVAGLEQHIRDVHGKAQGGGK